MAKSVLVIGASHGGTAVAASLRQQGFHGQLTLVGSEASLPYNRPPLSKTYLSEKQSSEQILLRPESFYARNKIDLCLNTQVTDINLAQKKAQLSTGDTLSWDELVFATGSRVRKLAAPGAELDNVFYLRTLEDANFIRKAMDKCQSAVIVGGGYIGLEIASSLRKAGKAVTVLEMEKRILQRVTSEPMSRFYQQVHVDQGVVIHTEKMLAELTGENGQVKYAVCTDGTRLPTDMVIVGIGVLPVIDLPEEAGIDCDNGILVDEHCQTSAPSVWAIGDCSNQPNKMYDKRLRLESVPNAMEQARVVASNLIGRKAVHQSVPWFWSDQYDLKLQMAGFSTDADSEVVRGSEQSRSFARFYWKKGRLMGVDAVNRPQEFVLCRKLLQSGTTVDPDKLGDPTVDLKSLLEAN